MSGRCSCVQVIDGRVYLDGERRPDLDLPGLEPPAPLTEEEIQAKLDAIYGRRS